MKTMFPPDQTPDLRLGTRPDRNRYGRRCFLTHVKGPVLQIRISALLAVSGIKPFMFFLQPLPYPGFFNAKAGYPRFQATELVGQPEGDCQQSLKKQ